MVVKAKCNFATATLSMTVGDTTTITDEALATELVRASFVEEVKSTTTKKKAVTKNESKRDNS